MQALVHYREKGAYRLHAFVLMPDHFHALLTPAKEKSLERVVQYIKGGSAYRIREELSVRFPIWQRGFSDHRVRGARDYAVHLDYITENPRKRGLVSAGCAYAWSSASGEFGLDEVPQRLKPRDSLGAGCDGTAEAVP